MFVQVVSALARGMSNKAPFVQHVPFSASLASLQSLSMTNTNVTLALSV
jgi:hypothetical protein